MARKTPSYRSRKGYDQALVTLSDSETGARKDYWLGLYGTPQSREQYHRLIADWEANGRRLPQVQEEHGTPTGLTVNELLDSYWSHIQSYYTKAEVANHRAVIRLMRQYYGTLAVTDFGPKKLRFLRERMIEGDPKSDPPRSPWSRKHINCQVKRLIRMFRWGASQEQIPVTVHQRLGSVEALKRGRSAAREYAPVKPVSMEIVECTKKFLNKQVRALIDLQLLTGARGGELVQMRPADIRMNGDVWVYEPSEYKTKLLGKSRSIYIGPKAQMLLKPFLDGRAPDKYLFSPAEADQERRAELHAKRTTPLSCGNRIGTNRKDEPKKSPGECYTASSYARAVLVASRKAFRLPPHLQPLVDEKGKRELWKPFMKRLTPKQIAELSAWRRKHDWHPHQLRHAAATEIRRQFGLEAAQIALGHSSAAITDAVYAERDAAKVKQIMLHIG